MKLHNATREGRPTPAAPPMRAALARGADGALVASVPFVAVVVCVAAVVAAVVAAAPASASEAPSLNAQAFEPAAAPGDGLIVPSARSASDAEAVGAQLGYTRRALAFSSMADGTRRVQVIFGDLATVDLTGALRRGRWTFEAALPVATVIRGGGPNLVGVEQPLAPVFGDLRLGVRMLAFSRAASPIGDLDVAVRAVYAAPTAAAGAWLGGSGLQLDLGAVASLRAQHVDADVELAVRARPLARLEVPVIDPTSGAAVVDGAGEPLVDTALASGSRLLLRGRVAHRWGRVVSALEGQLHLDVDPGATAGQALAEGLAVAELPLERGAFRLFAAVGGAATGGWASPQLRVVAGLRVRPDRLPADKDGDGIDDRDDACPDAAEDVDGFDDKDGCPDLDDDGDGIPDTADRCRLEPEDKDGYEDADGCPDLDDDGDGIPDSDDRCPRAAEDKDGFEDADGCPDPDNDGDGIPDGDDLCRLAPENRNGFEDADGCPDLAPPPPVSLAPGRLLLATPIRFVPGSAEVDRASQQIIGQVVLFLRAHREIKALEVAVFVDDQGTLEERLAITAARAASVKALLLRGSGLEDHQIRAVGMADAMPVASNDDADGRSRNRRVELRVLAGPDAVAPLQAPKAASPPKRRRRR